MALGTRGPDQRRARTAFLVFAIGLLLLLFVWLSAMCRGTPPALGLVTTSAFAAAPGPADDASAEPAAQADRTTVVRGWSIALGTGLILVLVFLIGSYAMVRANRRRMEAAARVRPPPSQSSDVWAMHRVAPDEPEEQGDA